MKTAIFSFLLILVSVPVWAEDDTSFFKDSSDSNQENNWVPPPPPNEDSRDLRFLLQADFQQDSAIQGQAFSMFDLSAKRQLDENSVLAEGLVRFRKSLSTSDATSEVDLRLARISYLEPWLQVTLGRFDLFQMLTPLEFFGAYPDMGIHRVDGVMATIPFSFFFGLGDAKKGDVQASSPLALSFFYTPSLFSAQQVQWNMTQAFWLSQLRFQIPGNDVEAVFKINAGGSSTDFFSYSSLNGNLAGSAAMDLIFQKDYDLVAEYGIQNLDYSTDTSAFAVGFQASRLGTWGTFSMDEIALEAQFPTGQSLNNPFTGGNAFSPYLAGTPQDSWYIKMRCRLKVLFLEIHVTNNQDDYTLARPMAGSIAVPFTGTFGPGNETNGPGTTLRALAYDKPAYFARIGVEF